MCSFGVVFFPYRFVLYIHNNVLIFWQQKAKQTNKKSKLEFHDLKKERKKEEGEVNPGIQIQTKAQENNIEKNIR